MKVAANSDFQALSFEHERAPFDLKVKWAWGEKVVGHGIFVDQF